jgi:dienelactone hydrolase
MFPHLADRLARSGLTAVTFNFSGSGVGADGESFSEPERFAHDTYTRELFDLSEVLETLQAARLVPALARPPKLGLFGHSRGGGIAILKTADDPDITALVTWASISTTRRWANDVIRQWRADGKLDVINSRTGEVLPLLPDILDDLDTDHSGTLDIRAAAGRIRAPWLIIHGGADEAVPVGEANALEQASDHRARLRIIEGAGHTFGARHPWQGSTPELDEAMDATVEWFGKELL